MKTVIMIVACVVVLVSETFILIGFLKKLKKIDVSFWGESAAKARADLTKAHAEDLKKVEDAKMVE